MMNKDILQELFFGVIEPKDLFKNTHKEEYNSIPASYCKRCLSLTIKNEDEDSYCDKCGSTNIGTLPIEEWKKLYKSTYNRDYIDNQKINENGRDQRS